MNRYVVVIALLLTLPTVAHAQTEAGIELTGYSGDCQFDKEHGGGDESSSGLRPRWHTLEGQSSFVMAAVPQSGGTANLFKKCFKIRHSDMEKYGDKVFYGGDRYGPGSNNQRKMDISHECTPAVQNFKMTEAAIEQVPCPPEVNNREPAAKPKR